MVGIKNIICKYNKNTYNIKTTNSNISSESILLTLKNKYNLFVPTLENCIIINQNTNKLVDRNIELFDDVSEILIIPKMYGGGIFEDIIGSIVSLFDEILFNPILYPIKPILKVLQLIFWHLPLFLIKLVIWIIKFIMWFTIEVASPSKLVNDCINTVKLLTFTLLSGVFEFLKIMLKKTVNKFGHTVFNGFWGWDQVILDEWDYKYAKYFNEEESCRTTKCYRTTVNKVPFSVIVGTIICPPIGVFMEYGVTGWLNIIACALLTLLYYFPGLLYALIILYC